MDLELGSEAPSASKPGGSGDLEGRDVCDICDADREEGNDEREVRRYGKLPLELLMVMLLPLLTDRAMYGRAYGKDAMARANGPGFVEAIFDYGDEKEQRGHDLMRRPYDSVGLGSIVMQCDPDAQAMSHNKGWSLPQLGAGYGVRGGPRGRSLIRGSGG